ncbi:hypothetical protein KSS87_016236, partial [Heliosperma pusillum]
MDKHSNLSELILRCTVSTILGIFTHLALLSISYLFADFSLLFKIIFSVALLLIPYDLHLARFFTTSSLKNCFTTWKHPVQRDFRIHAQWIFQPVQLDFRIHAQWIFQVGVVLLTFRFLVFMLAALAVNS